MADILSQAEIDALLDFGQLDELNVDRTASLTADEERGAMIVNHMIDTKLVTMADAVRTTTGDDGMWQAVQGTVTITDNTDSFNEMQHQRYEEWLKQLPKQDMRQIADNSIHYQRLEKYEKLIAEQEGRIKLLEAKIKVLYNILPRFVDGDSEQTEPDHKQVA